MWISNFPSTICWRDSSFPNEWPYHLHQKSLDLNSTEIKPVNPKGNKPWIFIGRTDPKAEAPILRPPDVKSQLLGKDPDAGKDWRQEEKGATEDEMVGWHHQLNEHDLSKLQEIVKDREAWRVVVHEVAKTWTRLHNWTVPSITPGTRKSYNQQTKTWMNREYMNIILQVTAAKCAGFENLAI